jgi:hypothetical protein
MAYYRGDYYVGGSRGRMAGDYYRGDPFWGALWTGIKTVGGALLGTLKTGAAAQQQQAQMAGGLSGVAMSAAPSQIGFAGPGAGGMLEAIRPGPGISVDRFGAMHRQQQQPTAQRALPMPSHFVGGARRRMNPANAKALRRSIRRVVGFGRLAMRSRRAVSKAATAIGCNTGKRTYRGPRRRAS